MRKILLVLSLFAAVTAGASTLEETFNRTFDPRAGFALTNTNGHISVRSWDQPKIQVHAVKKVKAGDPEVAKKAMAELRIEPTVTSDSVSINTIYPKNRGGGFFDWLAGQDVSMDVEYDISVPRSISLNLETTNGAIEIEGVTGSHHISTTNGHIDLTRCGGDVEAETTNGGIKAELTEVNPGKSIRLETTNGRISVAVPKTIAARVDASTTNGSVNTDLPVTTTEMRNHRLRGTINGGGTAELKLRTTNGSISIEAR
jgi:putative adhesin